MRKSFVLTTAAGLVALGTALSMSASAAGNTVTVRPSNMQGWSFIDDNTNGPGTGTIAAGPETPPMGVGSVQLTLTGETDRQIIATPAYAGTPLSSITDLDYSSYQSGPPSVLAVSLQFDVRYDPTDTGYQGRLVFEPYQSNTVGAGWQHWDALAGVWYASKTTAAGSNGLCPQSNPCSWSQVTTNWPDASILGNLLLKAGAPWQAGTYSADALTVGVDDNNTTYDFEPDVVLTSKDQCKDGGWATSTAPVFKNQGECVSYFAAGK